MAGPFSQLPNFSESFWPDLFNRAAAPITKPVSAEEAYTKADQARRDLIAEKSKSDERDKASCRVEEVRQAKINHPSAHQPSSDYKPIQVTDAIPPRQWRNRTR